MVDKDNNVFALFRIVIVPILFELAVNTFTDIHINTMKRFALDLFRSPNLPQKPWNDKKRENGT